MTGSQSLGRRISHRQGQRHRNRPMNGATAEKPSLTFGEQVRSFPRAFWVANVIELIERFSFYGIRIVGGLYVVTAVEKGGLGLSNTDKGIFWGTWALVQCLVPMFSG